MPRIMALLEYNEITNKKYIVFENDPYEVLDSHVFRKQQRKPVNATKLKNLISGRVVEHSFHQSEKVQEAEIETRNVKYLYAAKGEYWFCEEKDPSKRFTLKEEQVGSQGAFMKANSMVEMLTFEEKLVGVKMPIKVDLKVTESAPAVKGNTAQGALKNAVLETGAEIMVPLFINEGDLIKVNTDSGEYIERVDKN